MTREESLRAEELRLWRKEFADQHDVPAFIVFSNKTLDDLVKKDPKSLDDLKRVHGFAEIKIERIGREVLEKLAELR